MTISFIIVLCAIVSAFLLFGGVLACGDFYSRKRPAERPASAPEQPETAAMPFRKAA